MTIHMITDLFEALTIFCFGLSWPISIRKSYIARTAKGKSLFFEIFLLIGYAFGIARKIIQVSVMDASGFIFYDHPEICLYSVVGLILKSFILFNSSSVK